MSANDEVVVIEGVKAAGEIQAVYEGKIVEACETLSGEPNLINQDSDGSTCFLKNKLADLTLPDNFMAETTYLDKIALRPNWHTARLKENA